MGKVMLIGRIGMTFEDIGHIKALGELKFLGENKYINGNYMV